MDRSLIFETMNSNIISSRRITVNQAAHTYHMHNSYEVHVLLSGNINYYMEQTCYRPDRGSIFVINDREAHGYSCLDDAPYERITTHFNPALVQSACTQETDLLACFENRPPGRSNAAHMSEEQLKRYVGLTDCLHAVLNRPGYGSDVLAFSYILQILVMINKIFCDSSQMLPNLMPSLVLNTIHYINTHLTENLSLPTLAGQLSINSSYLSRKFKKETGSTIQNFILLKRVSLAKSYLAEGRNVQEACDLSGFCDYSNFIRTFTRLTGISPGRYRQAAHSGRQIEK